MANPAARNLDKILFALKKMIKLFFHSFTCSYNIYYLKNIGRFKDVTNLIDINSKIWELFCPI